MNGSNYSFRATNTLASIPDVGQWTVAPIEVPVQDQTQEPSKRTGISISSTSIFWGVNYDVSHAPDAGNLERMAPRAQPPASATQVARSKPRSTQEKIRQELFADWVVKPLYPMDEERYRRSWQIPFVFRDYFGSPVGVSMWELYYGHEAVKDGELPGEGLRGHGMGFVCLNIPVSRHEIFCDMPWSRPGLTGAAGRQWMDSREHREYFLFCDIDNDDKYISERESPDDERASINCIGKRIAGWFLRYMRVSIIGVVSYRKSLILYMRPCSSSRGKPAPRIRPGTELNSPRYTLSAYILTTRMGGTGTPISV